MASPLRKKEKFSSENRRLISSTAISEHEQQQPMGSLVTSIGKRQNVRVAKKMNQSLGTTKPKRCCWICTDVLMDIFPYFDHAQLGLKMALLSPRFNVLVDSHFDGKNELTIWKLIQIHKLRTAPKLSVLVNNHKLVPFPLPFHPLPSKIRFNCLRIEYIDHSVIAFLRSNKQIFDGRGTNLYLTFEYLKADDEIPTLDVFAREILPIFVPNIRHLDFPNADHLVILLRFTSPTILTDCNQLNSICSYRMLPDATIADDHFDGLPNATFSVAGQALSKWLHTPTTDGQPKRFHCIYYHDSSCRPISIDEWLNNFKKAFLRATISSACYILKFDVSATIDPFELVNNATNEKLTLSREHPNWAIKRCQIGQMVQWEDGRPKIMNTSLFYLCGNRASLGWKNVNNAIVSRRVKAAEKGVELCESEFHSMRNDRQFWRLLNGQINLLISDHF